MCRTSVGIVDYRAGNLKSLSSALNELDVDVHIVSCPADLNFVSHLILPGVGSFRSGMEHLILSGMKAAIKSWVNDTNKPLLGICLGFQLLCVNGDEHGFTEGLGLIDGRCVSLETKVRCDKNFSIPNVGFCYIPPEEDIFGTGGGWHYLIHGFHVELNQDSFSQMRTQAILVGETKILAGVKRGNLWGVQYHPEKSQRNGIELLRNFVENER